MTTAAPARPDEMEAKIDALTEQVAFLAEEAKQARQRRQMWTDLQQDVMPIAGDVLEVVSKELDELSADVEISDFADLLRRLVRVAPVLDKGLAYVEMFAELVNDMLPLSDHAMDVATDRLVTLDKKGYFAFAKGGLSVVDRVVTGFSEDDVAALGDNVVLILETVKEMTQPEVMAVLYRMIEAVQHQQHLMEQEPQEAPSLFSLARQMRDPEIRKGMSRALNTLRAVSEVQSGMPSHIEEQPVETEPGGK